MQLVITQPHHWTQHLALPRTAFKPGQSGNLNGRPKGSIAYRDRLSIQERIKMAEEAGCTPLQFMVSVMLEPENALAMRLDAAKFAAPYFHRKMPISVELPNTAPQFDVAKLVALPADERRQLLETLKKLGVELGDPAGTPSLPPPGKMATIYAKADAVGRPIAPGVAESLARYSSPVKAALAETGAVSPTLTPTLKPAPGTKQVRAPYKPRVKK